MFGFFERRKAIKDARARIGVELHRQLKAAISQDERLTEKNLSSAFTVGYIYWFVRMGFSLQGIDGGEVVDEQLKLVCDGVMPSGKLHEIFQRQLAALETAQGMKDQTSPMGLGEILPADLTKLFEAGAEAGLSDAAALSANPSNFKHYLVGEKLHYITVAK